MAFVTVSDAYEVTVPRDVAERAGLRPGQRLAAVAVGSHVTLVPVRPLPARLGLTDGGVPGSHSRPDLDVDERHAPAGPPRPILTDSCVPDP